MNELTQLINLTNQWIGESCERKQHIAQERCRCWRQWNGHIALSAFLFVFIAIADIVTKLYGLSACSLLFVGCVVQAACYRSFNDKGYAELEQMIDDRINELISERDQYQKELKEYGC